MTTGSETSRRKEWACRLLLSLLLVRSASGYAVGLQTEHQLVSPLIPSSVVYEIASPWWPPCFTASAILLVALWFYFLQKKTATIVASSTALLVLEIWTRYFLG